ncbi:uncharacterized protein LOC126896095 isoform X2 [Daktulosphaira vitifoliae]|uniref:uncharacterized protein LOC126896095 isoform X2 n=1 Tax=Daktulosphaira vitifoliae TaxID=58002 RepID=UPI0021A98D2E|nr:uncharacterized protein LOC126896095 isoform X2 [Daktulosphaira vitifoliae]
MLADAAEFAMVSVGMFLSSTAVAIVLVVGAYAVYGHRRQRINLPHINHREILNKKLKLKVASHEKNDDHETFFEVREYLERLVEGLVDGGLDDVCLTPLSTHPDYMSICWKYHEKLATILNDAIHSIIKDEFENIPKRLKSILDELYSEVEALPELQSAQKKCVVPLAEDLEEKDYEDLLATAILNKIVSNSQTKKRIPNGNSRFGKFSSRNSASSLNSSSSKKTDNSRCKIIPERISFTVEERVEEVTTTSYNTYSDVEADYDDGYNEGDEEDEERSQSTLGLFMSNAKLLRGYKTPLPDFESDIVTDGKNYLDDHGISSTVDSWEDNWLFQKKKQNRNVNGSNNFHHHPVPVPMLVPNPCEDTKPLIGDRDADETSELSDYSNSALDELLDLSDSQESETTKPTVLDKKMIRLMFDSPSSEEDNPLNWDPVLEACNKHVTLTQIDSGQGSLDLQKENEQTVEIVNIIEKPVPRPRSSLSSNVMNETVPNMETEERITEDSMPPRPGTIAEREHLKWEKALPLINNPYSAENIEKRKYKSKFGSMSSSDSSLDLSNSNDSPKPLKIVCSPKLPDSERYGRDYYINSSENNTSNAKQTKVSKLVVHLEDNDQQRKQQAILNNERCQEVVKVCSWSDRQTSPLQSPAKETSGENGIHMPSVKELAKHFSSNIAENKSTSSFKQVHSLTARSIGRQFREGLGLKVRERNDHNKQDSDDSGNGSTHLEDTNITL